MSVLMLFVIGAAIFAVVALVLGLVLLTAGRGGRASAHANSLRCPDCQRWIELPTLACGHCGRPLDEPGPGGVLETPPVDANPFRAPRAASHSASRSSFGWIVLVVGVVLIVAAGLFLLWLVQPVVFGLQA